MNVTETFEYILWICFLRIDDLTIDNRINHFSGRVHNITVTDYQISVLSNLDTSYPVLDSKVLCRMDSDRLQRFKFVHTGFDRKS